MAVGNLTIELKLDMRDLMNVSDQVIGEIEGLGKERDEAVAHVDRMKKEWEKNDANNVSTAEKLELLVDLLYGEPSKSLAKRDMSSQEEALEWFDQRQAAADKLLQQSEEF